MSRKEANSEKRTILLKAWARIEDDQIQNFSERETYRFFVLSLFFLRLISHRFISRRGEIEIKFGKSYLNDPSFYHKEGVLFLPEEILWQDIYSQYINEEILDLLENSFQVISEKNGELCSEIFEKGFFRNLKIINKQRVRELMDIINDFSEEDLPFFFSGILNKFAEEDAPEKVNRFNQLISTTPQNILRLMIHLLQPNKGKIYDPCCGCGNVFIETSKYISQELGKDANILSNYGQEKYKEIWKICKMHLISRGLTDSNLGNFPDCTLKNDQHPNLQADYIISHPPAHLPWSPTENDPRWEGFINTFPLANYAWILHCWYHLSEGGQCALLLRTRSVLGETENQAAESRREFAQKGLVEAIISLPEKACYNRQDYASAIWIIRKSKNGSTSASEDRELKDRKGEILFIDARDKKLERDLDFTEIVDTYLSWRYKDSSRKYEDKKGFCRSVTLEELNKNKYFSFFPNDYCDKQFNGSESTYEKFVSVEEISKLEKLFKLSDKYERKILRLLKKLS